MKKVDKMTELIKAEFKLHPKALLKDYYKLFYQDTFGPGHIIKDRTSAEKYLKTELAEVSEYEENNFQDISYLNNYYRVNINVINKGIISFEKFLDAFIKSAEVENTISFEEWQKTWEKIEMQILNLDIPTKKTESYEIKKIIQKKKIVSHSNIYRESYHPHYRLINSELLRELLL